MLKYIIKKTKIELNYIKSHIKALRGINKHYLNLNKKYIFIFFAADYANLGDIAITLAQEQFLRQLFENEYQIIKVYVSETYDWMYAIKRVPKDNIIITMIGGGNSGSLYEFIETPRRFLMKFFKTYRIISFPQTIIIDDSEEARAIRDSFGQVTRKCKNLVLVAREKCSEKLYNQITDVQVLLTPDIVFSYKKSNNEEKQRNEEKVVFVMREDKEKKIDLNTQNEIINLIKNRYSCVEFLDTCDIEYKKDDLEKILQEYMDKLQEVKFVITDRLHGMILSYITKTPCIVIANNNWKIESTYNTWLQDQKLIKLFNPANDSLLDLEIMINEIGQQKNNFSNNLIKEFEPLKKLLKGEKDAGD